MIEMEKITIVNTQEAHEKMEEISSVADEIHQSLVVERKNPTMLESIYVQYFLPILCEESNDKDHWINRWISLVGNVSTPVDIIKDGTNEYLFTSPPILKTKDLGLRSNFSTLKDVVTEFKMREANSVMGSENWLEGKLLETKDQMKFDDVNLSEDMQQWYVILNRYNKLESQSGLEDIGSCDCGEEHSVNQQNNSEDELEDLLLL